MPLGELLSNNEIERTYDLVDGKNNPTMVSKTTVKSRTFKAWLFPVLFVSHFVCFLRV